MMAHDGVPPEFTPMSAEEEGAFWAEIEGNSFEMPRAPTDTRDALTRTQSVTSTVLIDYDDLDLGPQIGEGAFATVYRGLWNFAEVAVKVLHDSPALCDRASARSSHSAPSSRSRDRRTDKSAETPAGDVNESSSPPALTESSPDGPAATEKFLHEVQLLANIRHPNVVLSMGACITPDRPLCVVSEYLEGGSLHSLLHADGAARRELSFADKLYLATSVCRGMLYLHSSTPCILHRDLKTGNVLVSNRKTLRRVVICDFGLSALQRPLDTENQGMVGTATTMAPEVIEGNMGTTASDVYSFAIVMWEIFTRDSPYRRLKPIQFLFKVTLEEFRPLFVETATDESDVVPDEVQALIRECWDQEPTRRPDFGTILDRLMELRH